MKLNVIVAYLLSSLVILVTCGKYTLYEIGIYSNCTGAANRTQLNIEAELISDFNKNTLQVLTERTLSSFTLSRYDFIYEEYDVCDNITFLAELVQNLALDGSYNAQFKHLDSEIISFHMHTSVEMVSFVKSIFTSIPVYDNSALYDITD